MKQLALGISPPPQPTLENFVAGTNAELLARLRALVAGTLGENIVYLWGEAGSGKSHLLVACALAGLQTADDVERLDEAGQVELFHRINEAREPGGALLAAGRSPPAQLALREDLRTRLGWGLVYQVKTLSDSERAEFLRSEAARRGMRLADDVIGYLLTHVRRDLRSLAAILDRLDRASLERHRHITVRFARDALNTSEQ